MGTRLYLVAAALVCAAGCMKPSQPPACAYAEDGQRICFATPAERDAYHERVAAQRRAEREVAAQQIATQWADDEAKWAEQARQREEREAAQRQAQEEADRKAQAERDAENAKIEAQKRREIAARERAAKKEHAVPAISAIICHEHERIRGLDEALARENRLTRESGGWTYPAERRAIAEGKQQAREEIAEWTSILRARFASAPTPCARLRDVLECHASSACTDEAAAVDEVWRYGEDILRGRDTSLDAELRRHVRDK